MHKTDIPHTSELLQDIKGLLNYHKNSGINYYPESEEVVNFMRSKYHSSQRGRENPGNAQTSDITRPAHRPIEPKLPKAASVSAPKGSLIDIRNDVATCTGCKLSEKRVVPVAGHGGEKIRLLVVGDWLAIEQGKKPPTGCLFGIEQDRMLGKMIDAIKLPRNYVFVTNVIKCGVPSSCQPKAEHVHACISYLLRQLQILEPELIMTMGMIATRALLNRRDPLTRLRGRLQTYTSGDNRKIPLIATYHPTFLLQNPEMKRATWVDLQLLAKQLKLD